VPNTERTAFANQVRMDVDAQNKNSKKKCRGSALMSSLNIPTPNARCGDVQDIKISTKGAWLAPELLGPDPADSTCASDIYALGMTIWEVFSNKDPYEDEGATDPMRLDDELVKRILEENLRPAMPKSMPIGVAKLVTACWQKVRGDVSLKWRVYFSCDPRELDHGLFKLPSSKAPASLAQGVDVAKHMSSYRPSVLIYPQIRTRRCGLPSGASLRVSQKSKPSTIRPLRR
jgi:hypothetical protein